MSEPALKPLTVKEQIFVQRYISCCFNASRAAREAGYSEATAGNAGYKLMRKPNVEAAIARELDKIGRENKHLQRLALRVLAAVASTDPIDLQHPDGSPKQLSEMDPETRLSIQDVTYKRWWSGKKKPAAPVASTAEQLDQAEGGQPDQAESSAASSTPEEDGAGGIVVRYKLANRIAASKNLGLFTGLGVTPEEDEDGEERERITDAGKEIKGKFTEFKLRREASRPPPEPAPPAPPENPPA